MNIAPNAPIGVRIPDNIKAAIEAYQQRAMIVDRNTAILTLIKIGLSDARVPVATETNQNRQSGAEAAAWARATAPRIGDKLGLVKRSTGASEYVDSNGILFGIKCARRTNNQIGLYNTMRDRIDVVICCYEHDDKSFDLFKISPAIWATHARPGSSGTANKDKITMLSRAKVEEFGTSMGRFHI